MHASEAYNCSEKYRKDTTEQARSLIRAMQEQCVGREGLAEYNLCVLQLVPGIA